MAENGKALFDAKILDCKDVKNTVHIKDICKDDFKLKLNSNKVRVMGIEPHNVTTKSLEAEVCVEDGEYVTVQILAKLPL